MATLLLIVIYAAFISLGLPDVLLGAAWPVMGPDLGVPVSAAGAISFTISGGTILSSLVSGRMLARFGTGRVTAFSTMLTALALLGFSISPGFGWLVLLAIPLGLGAGSIDAGINNYVSKYYAAHHMNWLHAFWGVGATSGPLIVAAFIRNGSWRGGYLTVSMLQFGLVAVLFLSLPLWKRVAGEAGSEAEVEEAGGGADKGLFYPLKLRGVVPVLLVFLMYSGVEWTMGIWGSTFLVRLRGLEPALAASWVSFYYGSIMAGRLLSGFVSMRLSSRAILRIGEGGILLGVLLLLLPLPNAVSLAGFVLIGLGCAPIFPTMLHETPNRFGAENAGYVMGFQMAVAYTATTLLPPIFGVVAGATSFVLFPPVLLGYAVLMLLFTEALNRFVGKEAGSAPPA